MSERRARRESSDRCCFAPGVAFELGSRVAAPGDFPFSVWCVWRFVSRPRCTPCKDDTEKQRSKLTNTMAAAWGRRGARAPARATRGARARGARALSVTESWRAAGGGAAGNP